MHACKRIYRHVDACGDIITHTYVTLHIPVINPGVTELVCPCVCTSTRTWTWPITNTHENIRACKRL